MSWQNTHFTLSLTLTRCHDFVIHSHRSNTGEWKGTKPAIHPLCHTTCHWCISLDCCLKPMDRQVAGFSERVWRGDLSSDTDTIMAVWGAVVDLSSIEPLDGEVSSTCSTAEVDVVTRLDSGMMWNWSDNFWFNCVRERVRGRREEVRGRERERGKEKEKEREGGRKEERPEWMKGSLEYNSPKKTLSLLKLPYTLAFQYPSKKDTTTPPSKCQYSSWHTKKIINLLHAQEMRMYLCRSSPNHTSAITKIWILSVIWG